MSGDLTHYFNKIAEEFNGYYSGHRPSLMQEIGYRVFRGPGLRKRFIHTINIIGDCSGAKILDVGCGPGVYAAYFGKKKAKVTAIDISENMVELARRNLISAGISDSKLIVGNFLNYDFQDIFDYSLAIGLFDYIGKAERDAYLDKLKRITLKKIVATFPRMFVFQAPLRNVLFLVKGHPVSFYTAETIRKMAKRHNLRSNFYNSGPIWTVEFTRK